MILQISRFFMLNIAFAISTQTETYPIEQKKFFERAAYLGRYRNLTDFIFRTVQDKAAEIMKEKEQIIASERDSEIFFDAITNPKAPSDTLKNALGDYNAFIKEYK